MTQFLDVLAKYPFLWPCLVTNAWQVFSFAATLILNRWIPQTDEQWTVLFAKHPRLAALTGILKYAGFAAPSFFRSLRALVAGPPPSLPRPQSPEDLKAIEAIAIAQAKALLDGAPAPTAADKAAISVRAPQ